MAVTIRSATTADAPFIAWAQVEAARAGTPLGVWDLALPGPDEQRLRLVAEVATSAQPHFAHVSGFLVAEQDGHPVGALSAYAPRQKNIEAYRDALNGALARAGWSEAHRRLVKTRTAVAATCFSDTPDDRWVVEWVAVHPAARGRGVAAKLIAAILDRGRASSFGKAQITTTETNTDAIRTYERAGFVIVDGKRDHAFEAVFGVPGTVRMWMDI
jgi:ribosomal protein S18 acetylase RimI-like enzyme